MEKILSSASVEIRKDCLHKDRDESNIVEDEINEDQESPFLNPGIN